MKVQKKNQSFAGIPRRAMETDDFRGLSGNAVKLLLALSYQFKGKNNGDLTAAWSVMHKQFGFRSPITVQRAKQELLDANFIEQTRSGLFMNPGGRCALYALAWLPIDECPGKKLETRPTSTPSRKLSFENKKPSIECVQGPIQKVYP